MRLYTIHNSASFKSVSYVRKITMKTPKKLFLVKNEFKLVLKVKKVQQTFLCQISNLSLFDVQNIY